MVCPLRFAVVFISLIIASIGIYHTFKETDEVHEKHLKGGIYDGSDEETDDDDEEEEEEDKNKQVERRIKKFFSSVKDLFSGKTLENYYTKTQKRAGKQAGDPTAWRRPSIIVGLVFFHFGLWVMLRNASVKDIPNQDAVMGCAVMAAGGCIGYAIETYTKKVPVSQNPQDGSEDTKKAK